MFTPDGQLREEYSHLENAPSSPAPSSPSASAPAPSPPRATAMSGETRPPAPEPEPEDPDAPGFIDLITLLAEPASMYLQQARVPDGQSSQNLQLARLHIDLLGTLQRKTRGNLTPQEASILEDALYQLRMLYVELGG